MAWRARASAASPLLLGGALAGVAFGAAGGTQLTRTTIVEVIVVLVGGLTVAGALLYGRRGPLFGGVAVTLFAALAAFTAMAVVWSIVPELTYIEAGRTLALLAIFAAALAAARLQPRGAPALLGGILLAGGAVVLYALASRVWPGSLAETELSNRIGAPFEYWNAVGAVAAMVSPAALWLGSRRTGSSTLRAAAYPALGAAVLAILLTQSRGALAAAAGAAALWFLLVPLRLRSLPVLLAPSLAAGAVGAWALSKDAFSKPLQPLAAKQDVAGEFGLLLLLLLVVLFAVGLSVELGMRRGLPPVRARRRIGLVAVLAVCAIPLVLVTSVAFSDRGLGGTVRDRVHELASETDTAPVEGRGRIVAASSTRGKYWREAGRVFDERPVVGTGPGTFRVARLRQRTDTGITAHAHGFVPQTFADMGVVGLMLTTGLLLAWLVAVLRTTGLYPRAVLRRRGAARRDWDSDRLALVALALVAVAFGLESTIDWVWFIPGVAAPALAAAGYVAGRGPAAVLAPAGVPTAPPRVAAGGGLAASPVDATPAAQASPISGTDSAPSAPGRTDRPEATHSRPDLPRIAAAVATVVLALLCAWAIWQPEASSRASADALDLIDAGRFQAAEAKAHDAANADPLTPEPLYMEALAQASAGRRTDAAHTLERAVLRYPGDPEAWLRLGHFQLDVLDRPRAALSTVRGALTIDPKSPRAAQLFLAARARSRAQAIERAQGDRIGGLPAPLSAVQPPAASQPGAAVTPPRSPAPAAAAATNGG